MFIKLCCSSWAIINLHQSTSCIFCRELGMSIICCLERMTTMAKLLKIQPGPALRPFYFCSWELQWQQHLQIHLLMPCTIFQTLRVSLRFSSRSLQCPWLPIPVRLSQQSYLLAGRSSGLCHLHSLRYLCECLLLHPCHEFQIFQRDCELWCHPFN